MFNYRIASVFIAIAISPLALAGNSLVFSGEITDTDLIAQSSPGSDLSFYFDMERISLDTAGLYNFEMTSSSSLSPWMGVTADGDFDFDNYITTDWIQEFGTNVAGGTISYDLNLAAGVYEVSSGSFWYRESETGLNLGEYTVTITGPNGSQISIVPAPATGLLLLGGMFGCQRRRR